MNSKEKIESNSLQQKNIISKWLEEEMLEIAKQSEHPRAFEVVGQLIKSGLDANKELMALHKTKKELSIEKGPTQVTNQAVFVGSTAELQKLLKVKRG